MLELGFELVGDFFGRRKECVVTGISGGDPRGVHEAGARPGGSEFRKQIEKYYFCFT